MSRAKMPASEAFQSFHQENPSVYIALVNYARKVKSRGFLTYSIKTIWGVLRWHFDMEHDKSEVYKLNDRYYSRYARLIMEQEPDLSGFFKTRTLRS